LKGRTKIAIFIALALGIASALSMRRAPMQNAGGGELFVPDHVRPIISRACRDCHTDQTRWPWYSRLPGVSTFIARDVKKGREHLNFSTWAANSSHSPTRNQLQEVCDAVSDNAMPPRPYRLMHPAARLSPADVDALCDWASAADNLSDNLPGSP
jgi:Haem-binding domain